MLKSCLILFFFGSLYSFSQTIHWEQYIDQNVLKKTTPISTASKAELNHYLIEIFSAHNLNELKKSNIHIVRTLDSKHCIVYATYNDLEQLSYLKFDLANTLWKLNRFNKGAKSIKNSKKNIYTIKLSDTKKITPLLNRHKIKFSTLFDNYIQINTTPKKIKELILPLSYVSYVSDESFTPTQETLITDYNHAVNAIINVSQKYPELDGTDFNVGIKDNKPFSDDLDVGNKVSSSNLTATTEDLHATVMASIIAGKGVSGPHALGVTPKAHIFSTNFKNLMPDPVDILKEQQVYLQNHSYGTKVENFYGLLAAEYDTTIYQNPELVHIFSSGNSGSENNGVSNLTGNFKTAKNNIIVGATNNTNQILSQSSKGPTFDGRIKPEIVAYSSVGTSNAAALVSGIALQLQQYYFTKEKTMPPNYLIKALLLNGADDIGAPGIDHKAGFGNVNALRSLQMLKKNQYYLNEIESNQTSTIHIDIPENADQLKVMLVWNDVAANPNDNMLLKNDLDLKLIHTDQTILPKILIPSANAEKYELINAEDHLNPVEQITIQHDIANTYTIQVRANSLVTSSQNYALVYDYKLKDTFEWVSPTANTHITPINANTHFLRWNSSFEKETTGNIEIDYFNVNDWITIAENTTLNTFFYEWTPPKITTKNARIRIKIDNDPQLIFSTEPFEIAPQIPLNLGFNCDENLELKWTKNEAIDFYEVYEIDKKTGISKLISKTKDTLSILNKQSHSNLLYVLPYLSTNKSLTRTNTLDTNNFEKKCYFENLLFLKNQTNDTGTISAELNSLYNIQNISLFKNTDQPVLIESRTSFATDLVEDFLLNKEVINDDDFFFQIRLNDGTIIESEIITTKTPEIPFSIYPNPLKNNTPLFVSTNTQNTWSLFDMNGKLLNQKKLFSGINNFNLNLAPGHYIAIIKDSQGNKIEKKLIIH